MSKVLLLLLALVALSEQNFLAFADSSKKLELKTMKQDESYSNKMKWVGFELPSSNVITKISWSFENEEDQMEQFGIFEGSNDPEFKDSVPLYMFKKTTSDNSKFLLKEMAYKLIFESSEKNVVNSSNFINEFNKINNYIVYSPTYLTFIKKFFSSELLKKENK